MAILSTNRQIHKEAASVLHSELTIMLHAGHLLGLENPIDDFVLFRSPIERIWRHDPIHGAGYTRANGSHFYYTPEMDGSMEPHVFARFKKIEFHIAILFVGNPALSSAGIFKFESANEALLTQPLTSRSLLKDAAKLFSNSPLLNSLSVYLDTKVLLKDGEDGNELHDLFSREQLGILLEAGQDRAAELFINSNKLEPLQNLSNIKQFRFAFRKYHHSKKDGPGARLVDAAEDLKHQIEQNWAIKASAKPAAAFRSTRSRSHQQ